MNKLVSVETCTELQSGRYLITYRAKGVQHAAYSDRKLEEGQSVTVIDGVVQ